MVQSPRVGLIMGSQSDWSTLRHAAATLDELAIAHEARIVSAHRTPERLVEYATTAKARGLQVIIAGAGGAAHLPGMVAAMTTLPVLGVPVESHALRGLDSLLSIVQMPAGVPVGTLAIGRAGAINAAAAGGVDPGPAGCGGRARARGLARRAHRGGRRGAGGSGRGRRRVRLAPGATIGILGGGQLGRMTALAAARLGYRCHVFAPEPDGPAMQVTNLATVAPYDDPGGARPLRRARSTSSPSSSRTCRSHP